MHLQFNEAYIRLIHQAFPDHRVVFHARTAHLTSLSARLTGLDRIDMRACPAFTVPFGLSPTKGFHLFADLARKYRGPIGNSRRSGCGRPIPKRSTCPGWSACGRAAGCPS